MSFTSEVVNKTFQLNIVLSVDGVFYSQFQVDSDTGDLMGTGSSVPTSNVGLVDRVKINPIKVDIRVVRTTVQTLSFSLLDKDSIISDVVGLSDSQLLNKEVITFVGFIQGDFDFSDYKEISRTRIKTASHIANAWNFTATEVIDLANKDMFNTFDTLDADITAGDTTLTLNDATSFASSGGLVINNEWITYSGKSGNDLTGLVRGVRGSSADSHDDGDQVDFVFNSGSINPITFLLQLLISPGGGGAFDTLSDGLGISASRVDTAAFTAIRDANFPTDLYDFRLRAVGNGLQFLEDNILLATNTRFFSKNGQISLGLLDQFDLSSSVPAFDEDTIVTETPGYALNIDRLVNQIVIKFDLQEGSNKFARVTTDDDTDSQTLYGLTRTLTLEFPAVRASLNGTAIVADRTSRLLSRLSTATGRIKAQTHFDQVETNIADKVNVTHRYIPGSGSGLGMSGEQLEVMSKAIDFNTGRVNWDLEFTTFAGIRVTIIAPSPLIASVTSQTVFDLSASDVVCYEVGDKIRLFDDGVGYFPDAVNTITDITGNTITVQDAFVTTLATSVRIKLADFDDATASQRTRFGFISDNTGFFGDGSKAYGILP